MGQWDNMFLGDSIHLPVVALSRSSALLKLIDSFLGGSWNHHPVLVAFAWCCRRPIDSRVFRKDAVNKWCRFLLPRCLAYQGSNLASWIEQCGIRWHPVFRWVNLLRFRWFCDDHLFDAYVLHVLHVHVDASCWTLGARTGAGPKRQRNASVERPWSGDSKVVPKSWMVCVMEINENREKIYENPREWMTNSLPPWFWKPPRPSMVHICRLDSWYKQHLDLRLRASEPLDRWPFNNGSMSKWRFLFQSHRAYWRKRANPYLSPRLACEDMFDIVQQDEFAKSCKITYIYIYITYTCTCICL